MQHLVILDRSKLLAKMFRGKLGRISGRTVCLNGLSKYSKLSYIHNIGEEPLRPLTVGKLLEETSKKCIENYAIISRHQNKKLKFHEVLDQADQLAAGLLYLGFHKGDRIGIWAPNLWEWYVTNFACARAGFITVALNPAYQAKEVEFCIRKVGMKGIICPDKYKTQNYYELLKTVCPEVSECEPGKLKSKNLPSLKNIILIGNELLRGTYNFKEVLELADKTGINLVKKNQDFIQMDDPCNIQFTSGTTGFPKAVVVSHFSIVNNGYYCGKRNELWMKHHKICVQVPFFHAMGIVVTISAALNFGSTLVLPSPTYNSNENLNALKEERCTTIHGTPTMFTDLIELQKERKEDICPEIALCGGALATPQLIKDMLNILNLKKVKSVYGLTETTGGVFNSLVDDDYDKSISTVGYVQEHTEAKVVDAEGCIVPLGTPGELCVRGYFTMLGYWEDKVNSNSLADKWLRTGDQFIIDENGYGKVVGRLKEIIIRGGECIFPKEIEDILNSHPSILEAHVIGLPHKRLGEEICACIRVVEGKTVTLDVIKKICKGNIANFKIPSALKIVESFPKTTSGKIQKFKLIENVINDKNITT